ncbi:SH3 domain-containing protein [Streptomyces sp. NPDC001584]|uniref:SH3 domain-containing protein n=1 Tax=Streptomyces sp. NPDC001584 TaxID=3154521 RepID=UPI003324DA24
MRRPALTVLLALTVLPAIGPAVAAPAAGPAAVSAPGGEWNACGYHPRTNVKLRTGPSAQRPGIGLLTPRDSVHVVRESGGWFQVEVDSKSETGLAGGTTGWVATKHVEPAVCMRLD